MKKFILGMLSAATLCWSMGAQQQGGSTQDPPLPPNHPQLPQPPQVPPGHPALPGAQPPADVAPKDQAPPKPNPDDVKSIDAIVLAYYDTVSGERGKPRDWNRLHSLMFPEARFITTRPLDNNISWPMVLSVEQFIELNSTYFERGGYYEKEIHRKVDAFGNMAQVFSTYESRRDLREVQPYSRGINSIQLANDGTRWWIVNVMWDYERPGVDPLPAEYGGAAAPHN